MAKFVKALRALWWIIRKPVLLNRVLTDQDTWRSYVKKKYPWAEGLPVIGMDQVIQKDTVSLATMTFLDGGSLPTDMMLLAGLAENIEACSYFEIGTWRGESVAIVASRAASCHTLCLEDEQMRALGMHETTIKAHRFFSEDLNNVTQLRGDSRRFDFATLNLKFDLIFIDGDHHYDFVLSDTGNVFKHLVHHNSIVVWHDYGHHPDQVRFEVMAAILDGVGPDRVNRVYHVAHTKCAIYTGSSYPSKPAGFPFIPEEFYQLELTRKRI